MKLYNLLGGGKQLIIVQKNLDHYTGNNRIGTSSNQGLDFLEASQNPF
jgi:hypothetical protein